MLDKLKMFLRMPEEAQVHAPLNEVAGPVPHHPSKWLTRMALGAVFAAQAVGIGNQAFANPVDVAAPAHGVVATARHNLTPEQQQIQRHFAQYLASGRSDAQITIMAMPGKGQVADLKAWQGRTADVPCLILGVHTEYHDAEPGTLPMDTDVMRAGSLIHEYTHCQVQRHLKTLPTSMYPQIRAMSEAEQAPIWVAEDLKDVASENISNARAVIELARSNGIEAAKEYATKMAASEERTDLAHQTRPALEKALEVAQKHPHLIKTPEQAFAMALKIGVSSADQVLRLNAQPDGNGIEYFGKSYQDSMRELNKSTQAALNEFKNGEYDGRVVSISSTQGLKSFSVKDGIRETSDVHPELSVRIESLLSPQKTPPNLASRLIHW